jgi:hypothetical protein
MYDRGGRHAGNARVAHPGVAAPFEKKKKRRETHVVSHRAREGFFGIRAYFS